MSFNIITLSSMSTKLGQVVGTLSETGMLFKLFKPVSACCDRTVLIIFFYYFIKPLISFMFYSFNFDVICYKFCT